MYEVYNSSIYNAFLKELRQKNNLTIRDLSKQIHYSTGLLSEIENDKDLLNNDKLSVVLLYYGYNIEYLNHFDKTLNDLFKRFVDGILYIDDEKVNYSFSQIKMLFQQNNDSILYTAFEICYFIYTIYNGEEYNDSLKIIIQNQDFLAQKVKVLSNIYLGRYYSKKHKYKEAYFFFNKASEKQIVDDSINGLLHFFLSSYYVDVKDIAASIKHCEQAVSYFSKAQNYRRLVNTNITRGNQYLKMRDYTNAKKINLQTLENIVLQDYAIEKRSLLNNLAFCYMMENNFQKAIDYFEQIPEEHMRDFHCRDYMLCLCELEEYDKAKEINKIGSKIATTEYYNYMFSIFSHYLNDYDLVKLNKGIIKALTLFKDNLSMFEIEFLHSIIAYHYKKLNKYKSAMEYLEKLKALDYH